MVSDSSEAERQVVRECIAEAFWWRSMPSALATGAAVSIHLHRWGPMVPLDSSLNL